jgi:hypothetical protein
MTSEIKWLKEGISELRSIRIGFSKERYSLCLGEKDVKHTIKIFGNEGVEVKIDM